VTEKVLVILGIFLVILFTLLFLKNWKTQSSPDQKEFSKGSLPSPLPNGQYKGSTGNLNTPWKGKEFNASSSSGINLVKDKKVLPFKTYFGKGLQNKNLDVLKIDYNIPQNPIWLRFILDEIVQVEKDKYLGKIHLRLLPGLSLSLGYFRLER